MSFLIISSNRDPKAWTEALKNYDPQLDIEVFPEVQNPEKVEFVLSWRHPHMDFKRYPNLKVIASMGAGIDHIIEDPNIPESIKITRVIDEQITKDMSVFVLALVLEQLRNISQHYCSSEWKQKKYGRPEDVQIGIMGLGKLGKAAAEKLRQNDFNVAGWSNSPKQIEGVNSYYGNDQLEDFLKETNVLVCLLPLTSKTKNILNKRLFERLPKDAYIINVARGGNLVEEDLLEMIKNGHLSGASLDVFRKEPLPENHPFWKEEKIKVSPHIASVTHPASVAPQLVENYRRLKDGRDLKNVVSRKKEY